MTKMKSSLYEKGEAGLTGTKNYPSPCKMQFLKSKEKLLTQGSGKNIQKKKKKNGQKL